MFFTKIIASLILSLLGSYYFWQGKKKGELKLLLWGIGLLAASYLVFVGDSDSDKAAKTLLNSALPSATAEQIPQ